MKSSESTNAAPATREQRAEESRRWRELRRLESWLEKPMLVLGFAWLGLLVIELTRGLNPMLTTLGTVIWIIFILDFLFRFALAPRKGRYLRRNVLTALSLVAPALRVFRMARFFRYFRYARTARGLRLVKVVGSLNRGMRALGATMRRRGFGYVLLLTILVTFVGAAGMYAFERNPGGRGLNDFGTALWWTAMIMTTMGSEYWPQSAEGRILNLLLAIYAFAIFGYVTATIASFFIGRDAANKRGDVAGQRSIESLREEIRQLVRQVERLQR